MIKLHVGCGNVRINGYINVDLVHSPAVDVLNDVRTLDGIYADSIDVIYACNVLEHFKRFEYPIVLQRWLGVLKKGGILRLSVPDFEALCKYYMKTKDLDGIYPAIFSCQGKQFSFHYWGWDFDTLKRDLELVGFKKVKRYDRTKTEHADVRDWSLNYLPRFDKDNNILPDEEWFKGTPIALNVEAEK